MPDKRIVNVSGYVRFQCPELLFRPELLYNNPDLVMSKIENPLSKPDVFGRYSSYAAVRHT
jgi:hypothetical protein